MLHFKYINVLDDVNKNTVPPTDCTGYDST